MALTSDIMEMPELTIPEWVPITVFTQDNGANHWDQGMHRFTGVVLARRISPDNPDQWATWLISWDETIEDWVRTSGEYLQDIELARFSFGRRVAMNCWGAIKRGLASC